MRSTIQKQTEPDINVNEVFHSLQIYRAGVSPSIAL